MLPTPRAISHPPTCPDLISQDPASRIDRSCRANQCQRYDLGIKPGWAVSAHRTDLVDSANRMNGMVQGRLTYRVDRVNGTSRSGLSYRAEWMKRISRSGPTHSPERLHQAKRADWVAGGGLVCASDGMNLRASGCRTDWLRLVERSGGCGRVHDC
ncbi:hypothetical protein GCM10009555_014610 [Acrocarpospora macrocephala]|uniref:Uncharacterized protein n=1 Tax=Acrocarpospora macrocephala TaxID=150177 RepID=A0A5M3WPU9_9ACTN|nr:hypothetical protein Amac_018640 [Acrocarpospora macrocephala]